MKNCRDSAFSLSLRALKVMPQGMLSQVCECIMGSEVWQLMLFPFTTGKCVCLPAGHE